MKKYIIGGLFGFVLATAVSANAEGVTRLIDQVVQGVFPVTVEGASIGDAVVIDNKTYLPVREFGEAVGYAVTFTEDREVVLTKKSESIQGEQVVSQPVVSSNSRISGINKELEEWNGRLTYVNTEIKYYEDLISDLNNKMSLAEVDRAKREYEGEIKTQTIRYEASKQKKQQVEAEITKLQAELNTLQNK